MSVAYQVGLGRCDWVKGVVVETHWIICVGPRVTTSVCRNETCVEGDRAERGGKVIRKASHQSGGASSTRCQDARKGQPRGHRG